MQIPKSINYTYEINTAVITYSKLFSVKLIIIMYYNQDFLILKMKIFF